MSRTKWHSGPPPSVGWWPASIMRNERYLRWWNGHYWSVGCFDINGAGEAERCASLRFVESEPIKWTKRPASWPKRSHT